MITEQYQELTNYPVSDEDNASTTKKIVGTGAINYVYARDAVPSIAVRKVYGKYSNDQLEKTISQSNLILSLLYSMENLKESSKYINVGFIKSSKKEGVIGYKMVIPMVEGGTLTQMFGTRFCFNDCGSYSTKYDYVESSIQTLVNTASKNYKEDLKSQQLADDLESHYQKFCQHAKEQGYFIYHHDLKPYNVMYNSANRCLVLVDGDSWGTETYGSIEDEIRQEEQKIFKSLNIITIQQVIN